MRTILLSSALLMMVLNIGCGGVGVDPRGEKPTAISQLKESGGEGPLPEESSGGPQAKEKEFRFEGPFQQTGAFVPRCAEFSGYGRHVSSHILTSEADAPHLGHTVMNASFCFNGTTRWLFSGEAVFTAANGDTLNAVFFGVVYWCPDCDGFCAGFFCPMDITGGTGRFQNATGSLTAETLECYDDEGNLVQSTLTVVGTFSY